MKKAALFLIRGYQVAASPIFGGRCRYYPSCSEYSFEAILRHGFFKGAVLGFKRLLRCHPFHAGGIDPVP